MDKNNQIFVFISESHKGLQENHTLTYEQNITYIDKLFSSINPYKLSKKYIHLKLIDFKCNQDKPVINDIDGKIEYLEYINKNTHKQIEEFIKKNFYQTFELLHYIAEILENNTYSIFIFIKSQIGYAIPLVVDGNDIKLEITYNDKILFMTNTFIT